MKKVFLPKNFKFELKPNAGFFDLNNYIQTAINDGSIVGTALPLGITTYTDDATITSAKASGSLFTTSGGAHTLTLASTLPIGSTYKFVVLSTSIYVKPSSGVTVRFWSNVSDAWVDGTNADPVFITSGDGILEITKVSSTDWVAHYSLNAILTSED